VVILRPRQGSAGSGFRSGVDGRICGLTAARAILRFRLRLHAG